MSSPARTGKTSQRALLSGLLVVAVFGCGHPSHEGFGDVDVIATVPSDVLVNSIELGIHSSATEILSLRLGTAKPQTQFEQFVAHVPVDDDDRVDVTATSIDGQSACMGTAPFAVRKGITTRIHVSLQCHSAKDGMVSVLVGFACPRTHLASYSISPLSASVGGAIEVTAVDQQDVDAGTLRFGWTATTGTFTDASASATTYRCVTPGPATITLVVVAGTCQETYNTVVTCSDAGDAGAD